MARIQQPPLSSSSCSLPTLAGSITYFSICGCMRARRGTASTLIGRGGMVGSSGRIRAVIMDDAVKSSTRRRANRRPSLFLYGLRSQRVDLASAQASTCPTVFRQRHREPAAHDNRLIFSSWGRTSNCSSSWRSRGSIQSPSPNPRRAAVPRGARILQAREAAAALLLVPRPHGLCAARRSGPTRQQCTPPRHFRAAAKRGPRRHRRRCRRQQLVDPPYASTCDSMERRRQRAAAP